MRATARPSAPGSPAAGRQRGVTYLALLLAVALVSGVLAASAQLWSTVQRREREAQLLWVGEQYRRALAAYAAAGDGRYPQRLEDLIEDPRSAAKRRHLRRLYQDPVTRSADWALLRDERGGIVALHSRSLAAPLKTGGFAPAQADFAGARRHADWVFAAAPNRLRPRDAAARVPGAAASAAAASEPAAPRPALPDPAVRPVRPSEPAPPDEAPLPAQPPDEEPEDPPAGES
jgi:type II secretory pathway pseudopilin PulG